MESPFFESSLAILLGEQGKSPPILQHKLGAIAMTSSNTNPTPPVQMEPLIEQVQDDEAHVCEQLINTGVVVVPCVSAMTSL